MPQSVSLYECAKKVLNTAHQNFLTGNITVREVHSLNTQWNNLVKLLDAVSLNQHEFAKDFTTVKERISVFRFLILLLKEFSSSCICGM